MALIKCKECGKEISDKAKTCPNCGNPIREEKIKSDIKKGIKNKSPLFIKIIIIIVSIIVGLGIFGILMDFIGDKISELKYWEEFWGTDIDVSGDVDREYYLHLESNGVCSYNDSNYEENFKFDCYYDLIKGEKYSPEEFILHLTVSLKVDEPDPDPSLWDYTCKREKLNNETKGSYYWVNCSEDTWPNHTINFYTKGTNES